MTSQCLPDGCMPVQHWLSAQCSSFLTGHPHPFPYPPFSPHSLHKLLPQTFSCHTHIYSSMHVCKISKLQMRGNTYLSETDFAHLVRLSLVASIFPENDLVSFFMTKIKSRCVSIPHFLHPHLCCPTPRLIP